MCHGLNAREINAAQAFDVTEHRAKLLAAGFDLIVRERQTSQMRDAPDVITGEIMVAW